MESHTVVHHGKVDKEQLMRCTGCNFIGKLSEAIRHTVSHQFIVR